MKRIGIVTLTEGINYGNKLQNYALLNYLKEFDSSFDVFTLDNRVSTMSLKTRIIVFFKKFLDKKLSDRYSNFKKFNKEYLNFSHKMTKNKKIKGYDYIVCGSDQIWNPNWFSDISPMMGEAFSEDTIKFSYAASLGISQLPIDRIDEYYESLKKMKKISVREETAKKIVNEMGLPALVMPDPTLLLSINQWNNLSRKPKKLKNCDYILTYFLGEINEKIQIFLNELSKKMTVQVINLNRDDDFISNGPQEFVYLIKNAKYILTDSFHATIFSIIYGKKFSVYDRKDGNSVRNNMQTRLESLLDCFELNSKKNIFTIKEIDEEYDLNAIEMKILNLRKQADDFMREVFYEK